jgi:hypothetical protein
MWYSFIVIAKKAVKIRLWCYSSEYPLVQTEPLSYSRVYWLATGYLRGQRMNPGRVQEFHYSVSSILALGTHPVSYPVSTGAEKLECETDYSRRRLRKRGSVYPLPPYIFMA